MTWLTRIRVSPGIWLAPVMALISMAHFDVPAARGYALASATRDALSQGKPQDLEPALP